MSRSGLPLRTKSLEVLIPILYLKGISTGDFEEALGALLGKDAGGLSASTIARLKEAWVDEHARWLDRDLSAKRYVYVWADGIYVQARLEDDAQCLLVIIGATAEGKKELVGLADGIRESAQSWKELLLDLKRRGLTIDPQLAIADGALGFWKAIDEVWPKTRAQRCWVHKTANSTRTSSDDLMIADLIQLFGEHYCFCLVISLGTFSDVFLVNEVATLPMRTCGYPIDLQLVGISRDRLNVVGGCPTRIV